MCNVESLKTQNRILKNKIEAVRSDRENVCAQFDQKMKKVISEFDAYKKNVEEFQTSISGLKPNDQLKKKLNLLTSTMTQLKNTIKKQKDQIQKYVTIFILQFLPLKILFFFEFICAFPVLSGYDKSIMKVFFTILFKVRLGFEVLLYFSGQDSVCHAPQPPSKLLYFFPPWKDGYFSPRPLS